MVQARLKLMEEAHASLNDSHSDMLNRYNGMKMERHDLQLRLYQSEKEIEELGIDNSEIKTENKEIAEKLKQQEEQAKALMADKENLQGWVDDNEQELEQMRVHIDQANNLIADLGRNLQQSREQNEKLDRALREMIEGRNAMNEEKEAVRAKMMMNDRQIDALERSLMEARDRLLQLEQILQEISVQKKLLDEKFRELDTSNRELREERDDLLAKLDEKETENENLRQTLLKAKDVTEEKLIVIEDLKGQNNKLLEKVKEIEANQNNLNAEKESLNIKMGLRDKEIDYLKLNLSETRNRLMSQTWVIQETKSENAKLNEKIKQVEAVNDSMRLEKDNLMIKAHSLKNRLNESEEQRNELLYIVENLKEQKGQVEDEFKIVDMSNKTLQFENEILNIKIQSKEDEEKDLKLKITQLLTKLNKVDATNNPQAKALEYEVKVQLNNLMDLFKGGVKVSKPIQFEKLRALIGMIGMSQSGKSFVVTKLAGEKGPVDLEGTEGMGFKVTKILQSLIIDGQGMDSAMGNVEENIQAEMEKNATEFVIMSYIQDNSNVLVMVVNDGSKKEEELIRQIVQKNPTKQIFIVHNMKDIQSNEYLKKKLNDKMMKQFNLVRQQLVIDNEPMVYFEQEIKGKKISHLIMAKEGSEAGDVYNDMSVKAFKYLMSKEQPQQAITMQPLKSIEQFLKKIHAKILVNNENETMKELPVVIEGEKMIAKVEAKLKNFMFDAMGNIRESLIQAKNNTEYTIMRKAENIMGFFNIPLLLEETVQVNVERLNNENYLLKIEGNRVFEGDLGEAMVNKEKVLSENMDFNKQFNMVIPLKANAGEVYAQDQEEMEINYEDGVLSIIIPVFKDMEVAFEMI